MLYINYEKNSREADHRMENKWPLNEISIIGLLAALFAVILVFVIRHIKGDKQGKDRSKKCENRRP